MLKVNLVSLKKCKMCLKSWTTLSWKAKEISPFSQNLTLILSLISEPQLLGDGDEKVRIGRSGLFRRL